MAVVLPTHAVEVARDGGLTVFLRHVSTTRVPRRANLVQPPRLEYPIPAHGTAMDLATDGGLTVLLQQHVGPMHAARQVGLPG